jgi:hypothetical protein
MCAVLSVVVGWAFVLALYMWATGYEVWEF